MGQQNDYVRRIKNVRKQWPECSGVNTKLYGISVWVYDEIAFTSLLLVCLHLKIHGTFQRHCSLCHSFHEQLSQTKK